MLCSLPIDIQQIKDRQRINTSIVNPVYVDTKENRARQEGRPHISKVRGGYPVERVMGTADLPIYKQTNKTQRILSTPNRPPGPLLEEKNKTSRPVILKDQPSIDNQPGKDFNQVLSRITSKQDHNDRLS